MSLPLRVLHVADTWEGGGAEAVFRETVAASHRLGFETRTLTSAGKRGVFSYIFSIAAARRMLHELREFDPDVVHFQNYYHFLSPSVLWAVRVHRKTSRRQGIQLRVVFTAHDYHLLAPNSGFQHFVRGRAVNLSQSENPIRMRGRVWDGRSQLISLLKLTQYWWAYRVLHLQREFDVIVSPSVFLAELIRSRLPAKEVAVVRNPCPEIQRSEVGTCSPPSRDEVIRLCFAGRVSSEKGLVQFVHTLSRCSERERIEFHVYGDGEALAQVKQSAVAGRVRLVAHGYVQPEQLFKELATHHALVLPSVWPENAPLILVEAAKIGVPTLTANMGGMKELSSMTEVSEAVDLSDPEAVSAAIGRLSARSGENAILEPEVFRLERYEARISEIYRG